ncbi:Amino Acid Transporter [Trichostrongylus colubriformis]|uniref:Amino Acid Transporter n=1 Tax=Trichostrongylus colubriformis TaxID=6319 RepID=A0AAN8ISG7_TRICO
MSKDVPKATKAVSGDESNERKAMSNNDSSDSDRNKMGFISCTSYVVGNIIGSGIFITPTTILNYTQSIGLSIIVWIGCGLISLIGAICYIELGTSITEPGCDFAYTVYVGWKAIAFGFMWVSVFVTYPASAAVQALTFGQYIVNGFAPVVYLDPGWHEFAERSLGYTILVVLTFMNFYAIDRYAAPFQVAVTTAKMLAMAIIVFAGLYYLFVEGWTKNLEHPMAGSVWAPGKLTLAFYGGLWSYAGWDILNYGTPEIEKPTRTMPLSLISGILIVCITYVAINISYFVVLTPAEMSNSTAVAADFAQKTLGNFSYAIPFMVALLLIGTLNSNIFCGSRFMHAAAREGHLPTCLSCRHEASNSPRAALLGQMLCTFAMSFVDIETLINYVTFVMWAQKAVTIAALLYLRYSQMPVSENAIKVPISLTISFLIISIVLVFVPFIEEPVVTFTGVVVVASGLIVFYALVKPSEAPKPLQIVDGMMTLFTCRLLDCRTDSKKIKKEVVKHIDELRGLDPPPPPPQLDDIHTS